MADDIEVHIDFAPGLKRVGTLHRQGRRGSEAISFEYHPDWLGEEERFSLEPALTLNRGAFAPPKGQQIFGSIGDSAPDTWGRRLMQRAERRLAEREGRAVRTLMEADYLLGVSDVSRLGALRFRRSARDFAWGPSADWRRDRLRLSLSARSDSGADLPCAAEPPRRWTPAPRVGQGMRQSFPMRDRTPRRRRAGRDSPSTHAVPYGGDECSPRWSAARAGARQGS